MNESQAALAFDWDALDPQTRTLVQERTEDIKALGKRAASDVVLIGQHLTEVKQQLGHGRFLAWIAQEFDLSERSARNMMRVASIFGTKPANFAVSPSVLYALAGGDVPSEVRNHFIERAEAGEPVRYAEVKQTIEATRSEAPPQFAVVNLDTGEIVEDADDPAPTPFVAHHPSPCRDLIDAAREVRPPLAMREMTREERAFDQIARTTAMTDLDPASVAEAAAVYRTEAARILLSRANDIGAWQRAFLSALADHFRPALRPIRDERGGSR